MRAALVPMIGGRESAPRRATDLTIRRDGANVVFEVSGCHTWEGPFAADRVAIIVDGQEVAWLAVPDRFEPGDGLRVDGVAKASECPAGNGPDGRHAWWPTHRWPLPFGLLVPMIRRCVYCGKRER